MSSDIIISVENLGKKYRLRHQGEAPRYTALRDVIADKARGFLRPSALRPPPLAPSSEDFWALKDVSFEVKRGEVVGIIGRNGAGKSTLLKILSRITEPTTGRVHLRGRVASLLEVGTGFHNELTGRENIFLNGAILGMSRAEIRAKFDEIVAFSEVEKFLDTPVKHFSSGMYVRLAFAVAAHLEPEILIVDEVLAVGDVEFQKKCLGKMQDVAGHGRTVLFVSHNMPAVRKLCQQGVLLEGGRLKLLGSMDEIISHYLKSGQQMDGVRVWPGLGNPCDARLQMLSLRLLDPAGSVTGHVDIRKPLTIEIKYQILENLPRFRIALRIITSDGTVAFTTSDSADPDYEAKSCTAGFYKTICLVPGDLLNEGFYSLRLSADIPMLKALFDEDNVLGFIVEQTGGVNARFAEKWPGVVCPRLRWRTHGLEKEG